MLAAVLKVHNKVNPDETKQAVSTEIVSSETMNRSEKVESIRRSQTVEAAEGVTEDDDDKEDIGSHYQPKLFDVWAMVITTVIGGSMYGWSAALKIGFGGFLVAQIIVGMAFVILVYSLAEIVSTKSFSGGSYGMGRVVLGFYPGFLIACFELIEYLSYSAASTQFISSFIIDKFHWDSKYEPLIALSFYLCCLILLLERNHCYWRFIYLIALFSVVVVLIYCFGSLPFTNFSENASMHTDQVIVDDYSGNTVQSNDDSLTPLTRDWFRGGIAMFFQILPYTTWGFAGIESGALVTDLVVDPQKNIPAGLIAGVWSLFLLLIFIIFVCCSLPPGLSTVFQGDDEASATAQMFMDTGFNLMGISSDTAEWLLIPAQIGMAFGFMLPAAKLYHAMAESKLLPVFSWPCSSKEEDKMGSETKSMKSVYTVKQKLDVSNDVVSVFPITLPASYAIYLLATFYPAFDITNTPILLAAIVYMSDLYAFYKLQTTYNNLERERKSPFGIFGVFYAVPVFLLCIIGMIGFMEDYQLVIMLSCVFTLLSFYYFIFAQRKQILSKSEQKSVFVLHVINFNRSKRRRMVKKSNANKRSLSANKKSISAAGVRSRSALNSFPDF